MSLSAPWPGELDFDVGARQFVRRCAKFNVMSLASRPTLALAGARRPPQSRGAFWTWHVRQMRAIIDEDVDDAR